MAFDPMPGGDFRGPWCLSCRRPIEKGQRSVRVSFNTDPHGFDGYTGTYHASCAKPFQSLARVINLDIWGGR